MEADNDEQQAQGESDKSLEDGNANTTSEGKHSEGCASPRHEKEYHAQRLPWWRDSQWWQVIVAAILVPFGIYAVIVYSRQLEEMRKSTEAATEAVNFGRETAHLDQRAWVTIRAAILTKQLTSGEKVIVKFEVINSGKTPALETETGGTVSESSETPRVDFSTLPEKVRSRAVVGPGVVVTTEIESRIPVTKDDIDLVHMGLNYIYANGFIIYKDIFEQWHRTEFCFKIGEKELQTQPFLMTNCEFGNTAD